MHFGPSRREAEKKGGGKQKDSVIFFDSVVFYLTGIIQMAKQHDNNKGTKKSSYPLLRIFTVCVAFQISSGPFNPPCHEGKKRMKVHWGKTYHQFEIYLREPVSTRAGGRKEGRLFFDPSSRSDATTQWNYSRRRRKRREKGKGRCLAQ